MKRLLAAAAFFAAIAWWLQRRQEQYAAAVLSRPPVGPGVRMVECDNPLCGCHWVIEADPYLHELVAAGRS